MNIDLVSPERFASGHPFDQYAWLRENAPVYWHEEQNGSGFWVISRYADVRAVDRDFQSFSSQPTIMLSDATFDADANGGYGRYWALVLGQ